MRATRATDHDAFDAAGRAQSTSISADATYQVDYAYNALGLLHTLTYPTSTSGYRLTLQYEYQSGQLLRVKDANAPTTVFWQANATNAAGQVIDDQLGNGLQRVRGYDQVTGRLDYVQTGPGGSATLQNLSYSWNRLGSLTQRTDVRQGSLTEAFYFDNLHRLDYSTLGGVTNLDVTYDAMGNITWRSDVGSYSYHATKKHAVVSAGGVGYGYDAGGQMTTRNGQAISWKSYALPALINGSGGSSSEFFYTPERQRWKQQASYAGTSEQTIYIRGLIEKVTRGGQTAWRHAIRAAEGTVAIYTRESGGSNAIHYPLGDHLGSVDAITDGAGAVAVRLSYAPFGQRRNAAGWSGNPSAGDWSAITATTRHGYTGHEHLDNLSLIHMNGRVYDPYIGRFTSADPLIDGAGITAGWNRFSYVRNNPLSFTDPSGFESQDCGYYCRKDGRNRPDPGPAWEVPGVLGDVVIEAKKLWDKLQIELFKADYRGMVPDEGIGGTGSGLEEVVVEAERLQAPPCNYGPSTASGAVTAGAYTPIGGGSVTTGLDDGHAFVTGRVGYGWGVGVSYNRGCQEFCVRA